MSVPTHFYKVVTATGCKDVSTAKEDSRTGVAAFVMPNAIIDPKTPLSAFVVPLEALEAAAGKGLMTRICQTLPFAAANRLVGSQPRSCRASLSGTAISF